MTRTRLLCLLALAGCSESPHLTTPRDLYNLDVAVTRSSYLPGDSVFVRIVNHEQVPFIWHRCPGIKLERKTATGWIELADDPCTVGFFPILGGETLTVVFVMPAAASPGQYRVQARLSFFDERPPLFWYPGAEFLVTGP